MKKTLKLSGKMIAIPIAPSSGDSHDPEASPIIDDRMLENPNNQHLGCIYLSARPTEKRDDLVFIAERALYINEAKGNKDLGTETFRAADFSAWFAKKVSEGWRFCG